MNPPSPQSSPTNQKTTWTNFWRECWRLRQLIAERRAANGPETKPVSDPKDADTATATPDR